MTAPISSDQMSPPPAMARAALDSLLGSQPFKTSPRLAAFLRFVVEAVLAGRSTGIKGYTIGVEALGRPESFNPNSDPIVRVEAVRLRAALKRYYLGEGINDPVAIALPPGTYVPTFRWFHHTAANAATPCIVGGSPAPRASEPAPSIATSATLQQQFAETRENIAQLLRQVEAIQALVNSAQLTIQRTRDLVERSRIAIDQRNNE